MSCPSLRGRVEALKNCPQCHDRHLRKSSSVRDHAFNMTLDSGPRKPFASWKARHVMRFAFSHAALAGVPLPELRLSEPPPYAHEVQSDEAGVRWHLPRVLVERRDGMRGGSTSEGASPWLCVEVGHSGHDVDGT